MQINQRMIKQMKVTVIFNIIYHSLINIKINIHWYLNQVSFGIFRIFKYALVNFFKSRILFILNKCPVRSHFCILHKMDTQIFKCFYERFQLCRFIRPHPDDEEGFIKI